MRSWSMSLEGWLLVAIICRLHQKQYSDKLRHHWAPPLRTCGYYCITTRCWFSIAPSRSSSTCGVHQDTNSLIPWRHKEIPPQLGPYSREHPNNEPYTSSKEPVSITGSSSNCLKDTRPMPNSLLFTSLLDKTATSQWRLAKTKSPDVLISGWLQQILCQWVRKIVPLSFL